MEPSYSAAIEHLTTDLATSQKVSMIYAEGDGRLNKNSLNMDKKEQTLQKYFITCLKVFFES